MSNSEINDGGPAFPTTIDINQHKGEVKPHQIGNNSFIAPGMTLRDYFAAKAMHAFLVADRTTSFNCRAAEAYEMADGMLKAREAR